VIERSSKKCLSGQGRTIFTLINFFPERCQVSLSGAKTIMKLYAFLTAKSDFAGDFVERFSHDNNKNSFRDNTETYLKK
jgi:hypothetical protein